MALVGAHGDDDAGRNAGSAHVFVRSGATWFQTERLTASNAWIRRSFGSSVALDGDTALIGGASGFAHVYELSLPLAGVCEFGAGCAGSLGVPVLRPAVGTSPMIGGRFDVVLSGLPANKSTFLIVGLSNTQWHSIDLPMSLATFGAPDCSLLVSGDYFARLVNTTGMSTLGFPIRPDRSLLGLHVYFQGYVRDPGANGGLAVSNGLDVTIGSR